MFKRPRFQPKWGRSQGGIQAGYRRVAAEVKLPQKNWLHFVVDTYEVGHENTRLLCLRRGTQAANEGRL
jgi:hypothetical protein